MHSGTLINDLIETVASVDELTYRSYAHNRALHPGTFFMRWKAIFGEQVYEFEKRYQARCQAAVGSGNQTVQCEKKVVDGDMCEEHQ